jgi:hypothetical protein
MTLTVGALTAERRLDSIAKGAQSPVIFSRVRDGHRAGVWVLTNIKLNVGPMH